MKNEISEAQKKRIVNNAKPITSAIAGLPEKIDPSSRIIHDPTAKVSK